MLLLACSFGSSQVIRRDPLDHTLWVMVETMLEHTQGRLPI